MSKKILNVEGQVCPRPAIATLETIKELKNGDILEIITDDKLAIKHVPEQIEKMGLSVKVEKDNNHWKIVVKK